MIHGITHPRTMNAAAFTKMVNFIPLDKTEVCQFLGWIINPMDYFSEEERQVIKMASELSEEDQDFIISLMKRLLLGQEKEGPEI